MKEYERTASGFTLVEMLVAVAIVGIMLGIAAPSFRTWIENGQVRNAAESVQNGLQRARAEAVSRNVPVQFIFKDDDVTCLADQTCAIWTVQVYATASSVDANNSNDSSARVARAMTPNGALSLVFDSTGRVMQAGALPGLVAPISSVAFTSSILSATESRHYNVVVSPGGKIKMCDPNAVAGSMTAC